MNALVARTDPDGRTLQWFYNGRNLDLTFDEAGTRYDYAFCSPCGALTSIAGPLGRSLGWTFDCEKNLSSFRDARNKVTNYLYGYAGELLQVIYPDISSTGFGYDIYGYPASVTNGNNQTLNIWMPDGILNTVSDAATNNLLLSY